jgi:hypothetical protein
MTTISEITLVRIDDSKSINLISDIFKIAIPPFPLTATVELSNSTAVNPESVNGLMNFALQNKARIKIDNSL